jgi:hypothetical protein
VIFLEENSIIETDSYHDEPGLWWYETIYMKQHHSILALNTYNEKENRNKSTA